MKNLTVRYEFPPVLTPSEGMISWVTTGLVFVDDRPAFQIEAHERNEDECRDIVHLPVPLSAGTALFRNCKRKYSLAQLERAGFGGNFKNPSLKPTDRYTLLDVVKHLEVFEAEPSSLHTLGMAIDVVDELLFLLDDEIETLQNAELREWAESNANDKEFV